MSETPTRIGSYPIECELGRGGMGVVYLGRDTQLDRAVAIKVLPPEFAADPERLGRFEREARILASLHHPNIAGIHAIEQSEGVRFLTLQYVDGETLTERLSRGPLPVDEALEACRQIALALEAAHEGGVIHRDLKPGNVKMNASGEVKVLDFGLARGDAHSGPAGSDPDLSHSPTLTYMTAGTGVILGTAAYMSPEQARGKPVDKRTDIWSFGCVLYECLTGRQAFAGETVSDTIALILQGEPAWAALPALTPERVRELIRHCFEKDPHKRLRDIGDARIVLEEALAASSTTKRMVAAEAGAPVLPLLAPATLAFAALLVVAGAAIGIMVWSALGPGGSGSRSGAARGVASLTIPMPPELRVQFARLSPDGGTLALLAEERIQPGTVEALSRIYVRSLERYEVEPLRGTERALGLVFSQDGRWIAFVAPLAKETTRKRIAKVPVDGSSPPIDIADWDDSWGTTAWLHDGDFLNTVPQKSTFVRVSSARGEAGSEIPFDTGEFAGLIDIVRPLPGDRGVFVNAISWGSRGYQIGVGVLDPTAGTVRILVPEGGNAVYSPSGHILFARGDALLAAPFDQKRLEIRGETVALASGLRTANVWSHGQFDLGGNGTLLYAPGGRGGSDRRIVIVGTDGAITPWSDDHRPFATPPSVTRDGRRFACVITTATGVWEVWISDPHRPGLRRLAATPDADCYAPVWSPDGEQIAFQRFGRQEADGIYVQRTDGREEPRRIFEPDSLMDITLPTSWSPDGAAVLIDRIAAGTGDVMILVIRGAGEQPVVPRPLISGPASQLAAEFSPQGRWIAYVSDETGTQEVYVCALRPDGTVGTAIPVSSGGGQRPRWSADGKRLAYVGEHGRLMMVTVTTEPTLATSRPTFLHDLRALRGSEPDFDLLPDGRVLLVQKGEAEDEITRYNVVLNWFEELQKRMGESRVAKR